MQYLLLSEQKSDLGNCFCTHIQTKTVFGNCFRSHIWHKMHKTQILQPIKPIILIIAQISDALCAIIPTKQFHCTDAIYRVSAIPIIPNHSNKLRPPSKILFFNKENPIHDIEIIITFMERKVEGLLCVAINPSGKILI